MKKITAVKDQEILILLETSNEEQLKHLKRMYKAMGAQVTVEDITSEYEQRLINQEAIAYLNSTDWVVAKISEASLLGRDVPSLLEKYADILAEREIKRALISP